MLTAPLQLQCVHAGFTIRSLTPEALSLLTRTTPNAIRPFTQDPFLTSAIGLRIKGPTIARVHADTLLFAHKLYMVRGREWMDAHCNDVKGWNVAWRTQPSSLTRRLQWAVRLTVAAT